MKAVFSCNVQVVSMVLRSCEYILKVSENGLITYRFTLCACYFGRKNLVTIFHMPCFHFFGHCVKQLLTTKLLPWDLQWWRKLLCERSCLLLYFRTNSSYMKQRNAQHHILSRAPLSTILYILFNSLVTTLSSLITSLWKEYLVGAAATNSRRNCFLLHS